MTETPETDAEFGAMFRSRTKFGEQTTRWAFQHAAKMEFERDAARAALREAYQVIEKFDSAMKAASKVKSKTELINK